jgi:molybdate transport system ATP-binding protein
LVDRQTPVQVQGMNTLEGRFRIHLGDFSLDVAFQVPGRGVTCLFGASGSGKTTLLRCVAGLEQAPAGFLSIHGEVWQDAERGVFLPTHRRALGYVFQEASLFPHLTVRQNLRYGWQRVPLQERRVAFAEAVALLGLEPLLTRQPARLSGGERQRVAIARALLTSPRLLLMDEPLASLDQSSKTEILPYLERLHDQFSIPVLYVSHSPEEVAYLADHLLLLEAGKILAAGPLPALLSRLDLPLARHDAAGTIVEAVVVKHDPYFHLSYLAFPGGHLSVPWESYPLGQRVRLLIHARDVSIALQHPTATSILNILPARILEIAEADPAQYLIKLVASSMGQQTLLLARITRKSFMNLALRIGMEVYAQVKSVALVRGCGLD